MSVINLAKDPYGRKYYAHKKRVEFNKLKKTSEFKQWKHKQFHKQFGRCAYCEIRLRKQGVIVHIDHIQPLYFGGDNNYENLVLTCKECNVKKWINDRYVRPAWLKEAEKQSLIIDGLHKVRAKQRKQMKNIVSKELDERLLQNELSWI